MLKTILFQNKTLEIYLQTLSKNDKKTFWFLKKKTFFKNIFLLVEIKKQFIRNGQFYIYKFYSIF